MSDIQAELRRKGQVQLGGNLLLYGGEWMLLKPGDTYLAQAKNGSPELLTVRLLEVQKRRTGVAEGKVFPKERKKKLYNLHEVIKVIVMDDPNPPKEKNDRAERVSTNRHMEHGGARPSSGGSGSNSQNSPQPRRNRPVPVDPRKAGRIDYRKPAGLESDVKFNPDVSANFDAGDRDRDGGGSGEDSTT